MSMRVNSRADFTDFWQPTSAIDRPESNSDFCVLIIMPNPSLHMKGTKERSRIKSPVERFAASNSRAWNCPML